MSPQRCELLPLLMSWVELEVSHNMVVALPQDPEVLTSSTSWTQLEMRVTTWASASSQSRELLSLSELWAEWVRGVGHHLVFCLPPGSEVLTSF